MILVCQHCGHEWDYLGDSDYRASCPQCLCKTPVPRKPGTPVRYLWTGLALIVIMVMVIPGLVTAWDPDIIINETKPIEVITPKPPVLITVRYELLQYSTDFLKSIQQKLGLAPLEEPSYAVVIEDNVVAVIPEDSKFVGITPTDYCLRYQYGTDGWYKCEVALL